MNLINSINRNRYPGYIEGSEWFFQNTGSFAGAFAAGTVITAKAAGGTRVKNIITMLYATLWSGATGGTIFLYALDGAVLGGGGANARMSWQFNLGANQALNYGLTYPPDAGIIGSLNTPVSFLCTSGGFATASLQVFAAGYQINA